MSIPDSFDAMDKTTVRCVLPDGHEDFIKLEVVPTVGDEVLVQGIWWMVYHRRLSDGTGEDPPVTILMTRLHDVEELRKIRTQNMGM